MKNRELFQRDPVAEKLLNDGQARIEDSMSERELKTLRWELSNFACEGQYAEGLLRIITSFLKNLSTPSQPAGWVSGFYGSGKSHELKMLHHLWANTEFEDGVTARSLVPKLPDEIEAALKELDGQGRRLGGLHAASGTLPAGGGGSVRLSVLGIVLRSRGFPEVYHQARFCLYLRNNGFFDRVKAAVEKAGKEWHRELNNLYVSPVLHDAVISVDAGFRDRATVRDLLRRDFPSCDDITTSEFIQLLKDVLGTKGKLPCTILLLDEVQLFIGDSFDRATQVIEVAEAICKQMDSRVLLVGAGQNALTAVALLQKLRDRFILPVELSDTDVETVTRRVLLAKRPDRVDDIRKALSSHSGEIDRQLRGTAIGTRTEDRDILADDYPLLPVRRRFWEYVLRAVDAPGTASQLRSQLKILHEALKSIAEKPLGTVVPADFIFEQIQSILLQQGILLREIDETIRRLDDGTEDGRLAKRLCGLIFMIRKLPREAGADIGVRATPEMLADLMISDLGSEGAKLRKDVPRVLQQLSDKSIVLNVDGEYALQTRESAEWDKEFRNRQTRLTNNDQETHARRDALVRAALQEALKGSKLQQGASKEARRLLLHFGDEPPGAAGQDIPVWVRDGWSCGEKAVLDEARRAGTTSPVIYVYIPKPNTDDLKKQIVNYEAAKATVEFKGVPTTNEGREAQNAMKTRQQVALTIRDQIVAGIIGAAKVFKGGGSELLNLTLDARVREGAEHALDRLFPRFKEADHKNWPVVIDRAKRGDDSPLQAVDWSGPGDRHLVCKEILGEIGPGKDGRTLRRKFSESPYGWPQDAIDAGLVVLHAAGHLQVRHKGVLLQPGQLDQNKIAVSDFRTETVTLTAQDKIKLRGVFQDAGVTTRPSDELTAKAPEFISAVASLIQHAGGEAPLPERPKPTYLDEIRALAGNEQLARILQVADAIQADVARWKSAGELAASRGPAWDRLVAVLKHAGGTPHGEDLKVQAEAIKGGRLLLDTTDRVTPLFKKAAELLRAALNEAHGRFKQAFEGERNRIEENGMWRRIEERPRRQILVEEGIAEVPAISVRSDEDLLLSLDRTSIPSWGEKTDALPQRFANAAMKAAKMLEPKVQSVRLTSETLKTEAEVKAWVAKQEADLLKKIKDGPVVIG